MSTCLNCGKDFVPYPKSKLVPGKYCSNQCKGAKSSLIKRRDLTQLYNDIESIILSNGRYTTNKELSLKLNVSTATLSKYFNISTINSDLGFNRDYSIFEELVYECIKLVYPDSLIVREKTFSGLKSKNNYPLRFDFFISDKNLLVEADGLQHNINSPYYVRGQITRDKQKNKFCKQAKIKLIRILQTYNKDTIINQLKANLA